MNALFFALLLAVAGPEVSTPVHDLGDFGIVPLRGEFVMAWSQGSRIYAERLDANLHPISAPFSFPLIVPASVTSLALASNGTSVLIVWHELLGSVERVSAAILDAGAKSMVSGPLLLSVGTQPTAAAVKNGKYRVFAGSQLWTLDDRLGIESIDSIDPAPVAAALSFSGDSGTASQNRTAACRGGGFGLPWQACDYEEVITFSAPAGVKAFDYHWTTFREGLTPVSGGSDPVLQPPAIAPDGDGFLGMLIASDSASIFEVRPGGRQWLVGPFAGVTALAAGGNGIDAAVVWHDTALRLVMLQADGTVSSPMTLSESGYGAKLVDGGSNQLVVLYAGAGGGLLNARIIHLQPSRSRAAR